MRTARPPITLNSAPSMPATTMTARKPRARTTLQHAPAGDTDVHHDLGGNAVASVRAASRTTAHRKSRQTPRRPAPDRQEREPTENAGA
jgi:hypothetical protein